MLNFLPRPLLSKSFNSFASFQNRSASVILVFEVIIKEPLPAVNLAGYGIKGYLLISCAAALKLIKTNSAISLNYKCFDVKNFIERSELF